MEATYFEELLKLLSETDLLQLFAESFGPLFGAITWVSIVLGFILGVIVVLVLNAFKDNIKNFYHYIKGTRELTLEEKVDLLDDNVQTLLSKFKYHFEYDEGADEDEK